MFLFLITFLSALSISLIGGYFSIIGLSTIFPGSKTSVIVMGAALEIAKVIAVLWLHANWDKPKIIIKLYLIFSILTLMGITSLGVFGYLSKAHVEHQNLANAEIIQIETIDERIKKEELFIKQYEGAVNTIKKEEGEQRRTNEVELDRSERLINSINLKMEKSIEIENGPIKSLNDRMKILNLEVDNVGKRNSGLFSNKKEALKKIQEQQKEERVSIQEDIKYHKNNIKIIKEKHDKEYEEIKSLMNSFRVKENRDSKNLDEINNLNSLIKKSLLEIEGLRLEKNKLGSVVMNLESEIGPLKYFVGLVKDLGIAQIGPDQAVRIIILIIVCVFDPLAVVLLIAAQLSFGSTTCKESPAYKKMKHRVLFSPFKRKN